MNHTDYSKIGLTKGERFLMRECEEDMEGEESTLKIVITACLALFATLLLGAFIILLTAPGV